MKNAKVRVAKTNVKRLIGLIINQIPCHFNFMDYNIFMTKKKSRSSKYATKREVLSALNSYPKQKEFESYVLIIEHKKLSKNLGLVVAELFNGKHKIAIGKASVYPHGISDLDSFDWRRLKTGESEFISFALDTKKQTISQMLVNSVKKSISEGRIPFLSFK